jgi:hypothetical protein
VGSERKRERRKEKEWERDRVCADYIYNIESNNIITWNGTQDLLMQPFHVIAEVRSSRMICGIIFFILLDLSTEENFSEYERKK